MSNPNLTVTEAAQLAGVSRQAIHKAIDRGDLVARATTSQPNSPQLITRSSFNAWMKKRAQPASG